MGRSTTVELCAKIKFLLGDDIPATNRLSELDSAIWRLELLRSSDAKLEATCTRKMRVFGFSRHLSNEVVVNLDQKVLEKIISFYEEEYSKQVEACKELIRKLESV